MATMVGNGNRAQYVTACATRSASYERATNCYTFTAPVQEGNATGVFVESWLTGCVETNSQPYHAAQRKRHYEDRLVLSTRSRHRRRRRCR